MPAAFATVMAEVDDDAATRARDNPCVVGGAIERIGRVAPKLAAVSLRAQCSIRDTGSVELVLRG